MNSSIQNIKRYHIAKVYRRDQPAMTKGRMREFYQCDFDIAGQYDPMLPDAEILRITTEVFAGLGWEGKYLIKINHRGILDGIFGVCGVPEDKIRTISSAVDKLDKSPWEEVRREMVEEKGLQEEVADRIWGFVQRKGGRDVLKYLQGEEHLKANANMVKGMEDMELLFTYLEAFGVLDKVEFNLSLARGLDYYTGVIYEVVTEGSAPPATTGKKEKESRPKKDKSKDGDEDRSNDPSIGVGSVAAGGRYDGLVGMFSGKAQIPCVGISFGVDRIFSITKARMEADKASAAVRSNEVDVFVMAFSSKGSTGLIKERMEVCRTLWDAGIKVIRMLILTLGLQLTTSSKAEFAYKLKPKIQAQFKLADAGGVPFSIILGEDELAEGKVKIKENGVAANHPEKEGVLVDLNDLVPEVRLRLRRKEEAHDVEGVTAATNGLKVDGAADPATLKTGDDGV